MNPLMKRYGMVADRSARAGAMDDVGGSSMGGGVLGGEPLLMGYQGGNPMQQQAMPSGGGGQMDPAQSYKQLLDTITNHAKSADEAEAMLKQFWDNDPSDMNGEMIDQAAKALGIKPPWGKPAGNPLMQGR